MRQDYDVLMAALRRDEGNDDGGVGSPLALLLQSIFEKTQEVYSYSLDDFLAWLESVDPRDISDDVGKVFNSPLALLADSVDELDGILLTALEELAASKERELSTAEMEDLLRDLWRRSFSAVASAQEDWLERAILLRGQGVVRNVYPESDERRRLYQYGFSPQVGRRFEAIAPAVRALIEAAEGYGTDSPSERLNLFKDIGALLVADRGFGFRARDTETDAQLLENWHEPLAWWLQGEDATGPLPANLRAWQRFVTDNFEFRLGTAIGAVVAQAWNDGAGDSMEVPSLKAWRATTGLPWLGFWARELLRWGTLDPLVAFALAQGLATTRGEAAERRSEFERWGNSEDQDLAGDDWIDPQQFLAWQRTLTAPRSNSPSQSEFQAQLTGSSGRNAPYSVIPVRSGDEIHWLDPAGFALATSDVPDDVAERVFRGDFELARRDGAWRVRSTFRSQ